MGKKSRDKGARGEREAALALEKVTGLPWKRGHGQTRSGADCSDVEPDGWKSSLWVEVKRGKQPPIRSALKQADEARAPHNTSVVLSRADRGDWLLTLKLEDLWSLYEELEEMKEELEHGRVHRTRRASRQDLEVVRGVGGSHED